MGKKAPAKENKINARNVALKKKIFGNMVLDKMIMML